MSAVFYSIRQGVGGLYKIDPQIICPRIMAEWLNDEPEIFNLSLDNQWLSLTSIFHVGSHSIVTTPTQLQPNQTNLNLSWV